MMTGSASSDGLPTGSLRPPNCEPAGSWLTSGVSPTQIGQLVREEHLADVLR